MQEPNARFQARERAGARHERRLFPVACMPLFGSGSGMDSRTPYHPYQVIKRRRIAHTSLPSVFPSTLEFGWIETL